MFMAKNQEPESQTKGQQPEIGISICPGITTWNQKPTRRNCNHRAQCRGGSENAISHCDVWEDAPGVQLGNLLLSHGWCALANGSKLLIDYYRRRSYHRLANFTWKTWQINQHSTLWNFLDVEKDGNSFLSITLVFVDPLKPYSTAEANPASPRGITTT